MEQYLPFQGYSPSNIPTYSLHPIKLKDDL